MFNLSELPEEKNFSPLAPGINIPVVLEKVEITPATDKSEGGNLALTFRGTTMENAGVFRPIFWANSFDPQHQNYKEVYATNYLSQLRQVAEAFLPKESIAKISGKNWAELREAFVKEMNSVNYSEITVLIKAVYKKGSDKDLVLPTYGSFISSQRKPAGLVLDDKKDASGIPYDRVHPLAHYGVSPDSSIPAEAALSTEDFDFPSGDDVPPFNV